MPSNARPRYQNPVIDADYSDPDAIRVGDTYWLTASSFNRVPGLPILRSTDLVHWEHVTNALEENLPREHFSLPRHGGGVWAPSIRHHAGQFHIVYPDPDHGIWVTSTLDPSASWSKPHLLLPGTGRIDPCPLWDEDGHTYLVYGWAESRSGVKNRLSVVEVDAGLTQVVGPEKVIIDGNALPEYTTLEGPKFYKRDGWYWIFAPAGGVQTGWQSVFRSRSPWGPFEHRIVLAQGRTDINGPHQGAWVDSTSGDHWFLHFSDRAELGRVVLLQPMAWEEDGWPSMGTPGADGIGEPVSNHPGPLELSVSQSLLRLPYSDDLFQGSLGPQWHWQANPAKDWAQVGDGRLRLSAPAHDRGNLRDIPSILAQRIPGQQVTITTAMSVTEPRGTDWRAGVVVLGASYSWLGVSVTDGKASVVAQSYTEENAVELPLTAPWPYAPGERLSVRAILGDGHVHWHWAGTDGEWRHAGTCQVTAGRWVGADIGFFATESVGGDGTAVADFEPMTIALGGKS